MLLVRLSSLVLIVFSCHCVYAVSEHSSLCKKHYPHWNCNDSEQLKKLTIIENFINKYPDSKGIVAFDWDGTLYHENINDSDNPGKTVSIKVSYRKWAANNLKKYPYLFPSFKANPNTLEEHRSNIRKELNFLTGTTYELNEDNEGKNEVRNKIKLKGYDKYLQNAKFESGMTLEEVRSSINDYLVEYSPKDYAYTRILDIAQRFSDKDFMVIIITAGNSYLVANLLTAKNGINRILKYKLFSDCLPTTKNVSRYMTHCNIVGNSPKLLKDDSGRYRFTSVFDDRFLRDIIKPDERVAVTGYGKKLILKHLSQKYGLPLIFYAGNSDNDVDGMQAVLDSSNAMGIFVNPGSDGATFKSILSSPKCSNTDNRNICLFIGEPLEKRISKNTEEAVNNQQERKETK